MNTLKARLDQNFLEGKKVHNDDLSSSALIARIAENKRIQDEKDKQYDLENGELVKFEWD